MRLPGSMRRERRNAVSRLGWLAMLPMSSAIHSSAAWFQKCRPTRPARMIRCMAMCRWDDAEKKATGLRERDAEE